MDTHDILSGLAVVLSLVGAALGFRRHDAKKHQAKLEARAELGRRYAALALDATEAKALPADLRPRAELEAFILIDKALDGKRDFNDAQARQFLDAERTARTK